MKEITKSLLGLNNVSSSQTASGEFNEDKINFILYLPVDMQLQVLRMLSVKDIIHFSEVSKQANIISKHPLIWENLIEQTFGENALHDYQKESPNGLPPKEFYRTTHILLRKYIESVEAITSLIDDMDLAKLTTEFKNEYVSLKEWLKISLVKKYDTLSECEVIYSKVIGKIKDQMTGKQDNVSITPLMPDSYTEISSYIFKQSINEAYLSLRRFKFIATLGISLDIRNEAGLTGLMHAAENGRIGSVEALINAGASLDLIDNHGCTALMYACWKGGVEIVKALITAGASLNVQNMHGETALILACSYGHIEIVEKLLASNALIDQADYKGKTALNYAFYARFGLTNLDGKLRNQLEIIELLITAGASIDYLSNADKYDLLYIAAEKGLLMTFKLLLADSVLLKKSVVSLLNEHRMFVLTRYLYAASKNNRHAIVDALFEAKGSFRAMNIEMIRSLLFTSVGSGYFTIVINLIPDLIALDMIETDGRSAMLIAVERGNVDIVLQLIRAGASIKKHTMEDLADYLLSRTALHHNYIIRKSLILERLFTAHFEGFYKEACKAEAERLPALLSKYNEVQLIITQEKMLHFTTELSSKNIDMGKQYIILNNAILTKPNGAPAHALSALMHEGEGWFAKSAAVQKIKAAIFLIEPAYGAHTSYPCRIAFPAEPAAMCKAEEIRKVRVAHQL